MNNSDAKDKPKVICNQDKNSIFCSESTHRKMREILNRFGIPEWILEDGNRKPRKCAYCSKDLDIESIRSVGVCLNAQHFGDIQIEILCQECSSSYHLQFRKMCNTMSEFCMFLDGTIFDINPEAVILTDIKTSDNNLSEMLILDEQNRTAKETLNQSSVQNGEK